MMDKLDAKQFDEFFAELHGGQTPFIWQRELLEQVVDSKQGWPELLSLPTASGKTACLDIALFALAMQADLPSEGRKAPRRIFFVVDRRIVVDEAYERAERMAADLQNALANPGKKKVLHLVASRLKRLSHTDRPLAVARLRGGTIPDDGWANIPTQPAIITGTVDQVGSRLLFRSYGCSDKAAPIFAGLVAYDSLIILDEAHCSKPFMQTVHTVQDYVGHPRWRQADVGVNPLKLMIMSATPPDEKMTRFPANEKERKQILADEALRARLNAKKPAILELIKGRVTQSGDPLATRAATLAAQWVKEGRKRIAVMVNRVNTATAIAEQLSQLLSVNKQDEPMTELAEVVPLTGRMRPIDRDDLVNRYHDKLKSGSQAELEKPIVVVTTQCLEVGADFDFDALISECASLDSLQQRFGRLDRLGKLAGNESNEARAAILAREVDIKEANDRIYGDALAKTWLWLNKKSKNGQIDFGINALHDILPNDEKELRACMAPAKEAPNLMPAHVDLLCQTWPRPQTEPEIAVLLHGMDRGAPQVRVAFRVDLPDQLNLQDKHAYDAWKEMLKLCPPVASECISASLWNVRKYQSQLPAEPDDDVEGEKLSVETDSRDTGKSKRIFYIWRHSDVLISDDPIDIHTNDTVIFPMTPRDRVPKELGTALRDAWMDRADEAYMKAGRTCVLRIHPHVLAEIKSHETVKSLLTLIENQHDEEIDQSQFDLMRESLRAIANSDLAVNPRYAWLIQACKEMARVRRSDINWYPMSHDAPCGIVLRVPMNKRCTPIMLEEDDEWSHDSADHAPTLSVHNDQVKKYAGVFAEDIPAFKDLMAFVGEHHDLGKLDPRFQYRLNDGTVPPEPLAKTVGNLSPARWRQLGESVEMPDHFRHEALSAQLVQMILPDRLKPYSEVERELILHLIASHHGYGRPFMPICADTDLPGISDHQLTATAEQRRSWPPAHRLDSGMAERFWQLSRHFGWWGLAYLEAIVRLADWYASAQFIPEKTQ